jgi:hypothetical protein
MLLWCNHVRPTRQPALADFPLDLKSERNSLSSFGERTRQVRKHRNSLPGSETRFVARFRQGENLGAAFPLDLKSERNNLVLFWRVLSRFRDSEVPCQVQRQRSPLLERGLGSQERQPSGREGLLHVPAWLTPASRVTQPRGRPLLERGLGSQAPALWERGTFARPGVANSESIHLTRTGKVPAHRGGIWSESVQRVNTCG